MKATVDAILAFFFWAHLAAVGPAGAAADSPTVTPASGGAGVPLIFGHFDDVDAIGYETAEFFLSGNAHSYSTAVPLTEDGKWNAIAPDPNTAAYTTRVIVHRPKNPKNFRRTVYIEWLNVSGTSDASPDWVHGHLQVKREGAAYVLVSAQSVGVSQLKFGGIMPGDPNRYGSLVHPGDSYSYDIFSQVGQAIWDGALLGGLVPRRLVALGESQSAGRMVTYINAVQPLADVYDGFVVHSRNSGGAPLSQNPLPSVPVERADIRDDLDVPVIVFQAETDVVGSQLLVRQPETPEGNFRLWEVAGTAHFDIYGLAIGTFDTGHGEGETENLKEMQDPLKIPTPGLIECAEGINAGPMHWVFNAALHWINRWVKKGKPPPIAPRLEVTSDPNEPVVFAVDSHGNTLGGIRTPHVDAPIAKLTGTGNGPGPGAPPLSFFCRLFGQTVPFTDAELAALYPNHHSFVREFRRASGEAVRSRFLLRRDARALKRAAARSDIGD
jgi:hypothetical protein